jgi:hypothetical protein
MRNISSVGFATDKKSEEVSERFVKSESTIIKYKLCEPVVVCGLMHPLLKIIG